MWQNKLKNAQISWLLESNPWTRYRTLIDLLDKPENNLEVLQAKKELVNNPQVKNLILKASDWLSVAPTRNNDPKISYFILRVLSDFGLTTNDTGIKEIIKKASTHIEDDMFAIRGVKPERPKKGEKFQNYKQNIDEWHIAPCNSPIITYTFISLGCFDEQTKKSLKKLTEKWQTDAGWFCHYFFVNGLYKKLNVGCPMAGLMAMDVFSLFPELIDSEYSKNAYIPIKFHKEYGKTMYYFGRSKKFWTMKYPFIWYNSLYLAEVLSRFNYLKGDSLVEELIAWIERSQDQNGRFFPTSMFQLYKGWDFANKKEPSPWLTFLCYRILKRWYSS